MYLDKINSVDDIKKISKDELCVLSEEVRKAIINRVSKKGGHIGPNLGVVELTVALHYVFSSPVDKFVFDVSHQCYPHKILTGRKDAFLYDEHFNDVTGYTNPNESVHDIFTIGHTSTSISLALGLAKARDLNNRKENIIAIIGDGSLSGGEALEGLDYAGEYDKNLIIIVNDNKQSIAENHGGIYKNLEELRKSGGKSENNLFKAFGLDYRYLDEGHDIKKIIKCLEEIKDIDHPVVFHIHTIKGKGLKYAESNKEYWHAGGPFNIEDGSPLNKSDSDNTIHDSLAELIKRDSRSIIINAGTPMGLGFSGKEKMSLIEKGRFIDVGIAEECAVAMASGAAKGGAKAVFGTFAPFLQRVYDQLSHDLCLNNNPATILVLSSGAYGMNSNTHIALSDIQLFAHIPNLVYLCPSSKEEYLSMLYYATNQNEHPVAIKLPVNFSNSEKDDTDYSVLNKAKVLNKGNDIAILGFGNLVELIQRVARKVKKELKKDISIINPVFLSGIDSSLLTKLKNDHRLVITVEDGYVDGGYGERIASFYSDDDMRVINLGISKKFHSDYKAEELLDECGISEEKLYQLVKRNISL